MSGYHGDVPPNFFALFGTDPRREELERENAALRAENERLCRKLAAYYAHVASLRRRLYPATQEERERRRADEKQADRARYDRPCNPRWFGHREAPTAKSTCEQCGGLGNVPCDDIECGRCAHDVACPDGSVCICKEKVTS